MGWLSSCGLPRLVVGARKKGQTKGATGGSIITTGVSLPLFLL